MVFPARFDTQSDFDKLLFGDLRGVNIEACMSPVSLNSDEREIIRNGETHTSFEEEKDFSTAISDTEDN